MARTQIPNSGAAKTREVQGHPFTCEKCELRKETSFCNLPRRALIELDRMKRVHSFAPRDRIFDEGTSVDRLMIVCNGRAILTLSAPDGRTLALGVSQAGEVLGLSSAMSGPLHEGSAEALETVTVAIIDRADFFKLLERFPVAALNAGAELSRKVNRAYDKIRLIGGSLSVRQRLAAWLLRLHNSNPNSEDLVTVALTHDRIGQILGVSRESVTRALSCLRKRGIIDVRGIHVYVRDRKRLQSTVL